MILVQSPSGESALIEESELAGYQGWTVVGNGLPFPARRGRMLIRIKELRDLKEFGVAETPQGWIQTNEVSRQRIRDTVEEARIFERKTGQTYTTLWRMLDNTDRLVTLEILEDWSLLIGEVRQRAFRRYGELYQALTMAQTNDDLDRIDVESGWVVEPSRSTE